MIYESATLSVQARYGVAELRFCSSATWHGVARDLAIALDHLEHPGIDLLVIRDFSQLPSQPITVETENGRAAQQLAHSGQQITDRLSHWPVPTVAYLDGPCRGAALELALACQWRTANGQIGTRLGSSGGVVCWGGTVRLPSLVGRSAALALWAGAAVLTGGQAYALGLIDAVWAPRMAEVHLLAMELALQAKPREPSQIYRRLRRWRSGSLPAPTHASTWLIRAIDRGLRFGAAEALAVERAAARAVVFAAQQVPLRSAA